jgi:hypothetical protein
MSPEQMRSTKHVDGRTDIWSIGCILYEMLSGTAPFVADTVTAVCGRVLTETPASLNYFRNDLPPQFEPILGRCLAKMREQRFSHTGELAMALAPFASTRVQNCLARIQRIAAQGFRASSPSVDPLSDSAATTPGPTPAPTAVLGTAPPPQVTAGPPPGGSPAATVLGAPPAMTGYVPAPQIPPPPGGSPAHGAAYNHGTTTTGPTIARAPQRQTKTQLDKLKELPPWMLGGGVASAATVLVIIIAAIAGSGSSDGADEDDNRDIVTPRTVVTKVESGEARLSVYCVPLCHEVSLDGTKIGASPVLFHALKPGRHTVVARRDGAPSRELFLELQPGQARAVRLWMAP